MAGNGGLQQKPHRRVAVKQKEGCKLWGGQKPGSERTVVKGYRSYKAHKACPTGAAAKDTCSREISQPAPPPTCGRGLKKSERGSNTVIMCAFVCARAHTHISLSKSIRLKRKKACVALDTLFYLPACTCLPGIPCTCRDLQRCGLGTLSGGDTSAHTPTYTPRGRWLA